MEGRKESIELLRSSARELSEALDAMLVPRADRPRSRKLLMDAWRAAEDGSSGSADVAGIIGDIDAVLSQLSEKDGDHADFSTIVRNPPDPPDPTASRKFRWADGILGIEKTVGAILRRTENMVKNATEGKIDSPAGVHARPSAPDGAAGATREELELVTGEAEE